MVETFYGVVQRGSRRGTQIGFPTVNIPLNDAQTSGIYAGRVSMDGRMYNAVIYADQKNRVMEAHLFGFYGDAYGLSVSIELKEKLRDDMLFADDEVARTSIAADIKKAKEYFGI